MNVTLASNIFPAATAKLAMTAPPGILASPVANDMTFHHPQSSAATVALAFGHPAGVQATFQARFPDFGSGAPSSAITPEWRDVSSPPGDPRTEMFDRLIDLKVNTATIAMHLDDAWRTGLFRQLDDLLDEENWHGADTLPSLDSFRAFLRTIIMLGRPKRPSLGCTDDGDVIASWLREGNQLTIECRAADQLRWAVARRQGAEWETAGGTCLIRRLTSVLAPYDPEFWFHAHGEHSGPRRLVAPRQGEADAKGPGDA